MGVQETIKQEFSASELNAVVSGMLFVWNWACANGHSGDIFMGVKEDLLQVEEWSKGEFHVGVIIRNRMTSLRWKMVVVYGPADHSLSHGFMQELRDICQGVSIPLLIGGDFNLVLEINDKST